ncbi:MAG TPA: MoxR family ATPase [Planctomycetota bacterium]|nr:MoxR family ATPase [Planctomycetota bacterium]
MTSDPASAPALDHEHVDDCRAMVDRIRGELGKLFVGQGKLVDGLLTAIAANGHVLVESLPGLGKTLLVKAIAKILGLRHNRIQFTPDLMPSDITGSHVFDLAERKFVFHAGPVFTQFLLADELNRAPAKTHAALLEVMQERQVTLDGRLHVLEGPFLVMATQNPIENEGTYNLPEAQLDRFLFKLVLEYPTRDDEESILGLFLSGASPETTLRTQVQAVADAAHVIELQRLAAMVTVDPAIVRYITELVRRTRGYPGLHLGASPRAGIAILVASRARALISGRAFVVPDDVVEVALPALRHRVVLSPEAEIEGRTADAILGEAIKSIEVPKGARLAATGR